eukprot:3834535-Rhodomonas_salina.1
MVGGNTLAALRLFATTLGPTLERYWPSVWCYALCGTDIAYGDMRCTCMVLAARGTGLAYGASCTQY